MTAFSVWSRIQVLKEGQKMGKDNKQCIHHWIIDGNNVGRCIKCGAVKDFGKSLEKLSRKLSEKQTEIGQRPYKRGRPSKL